MLTALFSTSMSIPILTSRIENLSSLCSLAASTPFEACPLFVNSSTKSPARLIVRMGGGPRTYPGGVSKWQWKRMQAKKAKQLLKARLTRERQLYEMRKRAELKAAVSELEHPWEAVERAPTLFSVRADEQVKALADRFQKPGGFDMWSEKDGPQIFHTPDGLPSARFFPKGAVHSVKPYSLVSDGDTTSEDKDELNCDDWIARCGGRTRRRAKNSSTSAGKSHVENHHVQSRDAGETRNPFTHETRMHRSDVFVPSEHRKDRSVFKGDRKEQSFSRREGNFRYQNSERKALVDEFGMDLNAGSSKETNHSRKNKSKDWRSPPTA